MLKRNRSILYLSTLTAGVFILLVALSAPSIAYADDPYSTPDNGKCITCHEDLYYLHDTGKWFCLKESPMACVDCHGGNPTTTIKEVAHTNLAPYPVINKNVSKCKECHPDQYDERAKLFDQRAGISKVLVSVSYTPVYSTEMAGVIPVTAQQGEEPHTWIGAIELLFILLISGAAIAVYIVYRVRHSTKGKP